MVSKIIAVRVAEDMARKFKVSCESENLLQSNVLRHFINEFVKLKYVEIKSPYHCRECDSWFEDYYSTCPKCDSVYTITKL